MTRNEKNEDPPEVGNHMNQELHGKCQKAIKSLKNKHSSGIDFVSPVILKMAVGVVELHIF